jgi:hypothetical protein
MKHLETTWGRLPACRLNRDRLVATNSIVSIV